MCKYREKENCPGCVKMDKPFWSDSCDLKSCCEAKGFDFCGQCPDFPCDTLKGMAAEDKDEHPHICRMEKCKEWCGKLKGNEGKE